MLVPHARRTTLQLQFPKSVCPDSDYCALLLHLRIHAPVIALSRARTQRCVSLLLDR